MLAKVPSESVFFVCHYVYNVIIFERFLNKCALFLSCFLCLAECPLLDAKLYRVHNVAALDLHADAVKIIHDDSALDDAHSSSGSIAETGDSGTELVGCDGLLFVGVAGGEGDVGSECFHDFSFVSGALCI